MTLRVLRDSTHAEVVMTHGGAPIDGNRYTIIGNNGFVITLHKDVDVGSGNPCPPCLPTRYTVSIATNGDQGSVVFSGLRARLILHAVRAMAREQVGSVCHLY